MSSSSTSSTTTTTIQKYVPTREVYTIVNEEANKRQLELLNETEQSKLEKLSQALSSDFPHDIKDKVTLVRFLKARKWDVDKSETMFRNRMKWISEYKPHRITQDEIRPCSEAGKAFFYGRDKLGRPILIIRASCHRHGDNLDMFYKYFVYLSELGQLMAPNPPHNSYLIVYDRAGSNRKNFDPKGALKMISLGDYYPEMIGSACVTQPNFLYQMLFNASKAFMDPVTISKIHLFSTKKDEMLKQWLELVGDKSQVLPDMGGNASQSPLQHYPPTVPDKFVSKFYVTLGGKEEDVSDDGSASLEDDLSRPLDGAEDDLD